MQFTICHALLLPPLCINLQSTSKKVASTNYAHFIDLDLPPIKRTSKPIKEVSDAQEQSTKENLEI